MNKVENFIISFVKRHITLFFFIAVTLMAIAVRIPLFKYETYDYYGFLKIWVENLSKFEGLSALGENIGEYNVPYMFFLTLTNFLPFDNLFEIKAFSVLFDFIGAVVAMFIGSYVFKRKFLSSPNVLLYTVVLFSPVVFLDSAYWGQCDFIYTAFLLLCLLFMLKEKYSLAMIFFGISFSFKLQAVFFLPVIIIYYFTSSKMSLKHLLWIPFTYILGITPALIAGRGLKDTLSIYLSQSDIYQRLTLNCPNLYNFLRGDYTTFKKAGIALTIIMLGVGAYIFISTRKKVSKPDLILLSLWVSQICVFFLPAMHERYTFLTCILSIIWAAVYKRDIILSIAINAVTLFSFIPYLFKVDIISMDYLALANTAIVIFLSYRLFVTALKENFFERQNTQIIATEPKAE